MGHLNLTELFEFLPILTNLLADFLSDRPKVGGRSTARSSAPSPLLPEESEVVSAGGQRHTILNGQIGVEEEASFMRLAQSPDPKLLPGWVRFWVTIHAVRGDKRPLEGAQGIVPRQGVCSWKTRVRARDLTRL